MDNGAATLKLINRDKNINTHGKLFGVNERQNSDLKRSQDAHMQYNNNQNVENN